MIKLQPNKLLTYKNQVLVFYNYTKVHNSTYNHFIKLSRICHKLRNMRHQVRIKLTHKSWYPIKQRNQTKSSNLLIMVILPSSLTITLHEVISSSSSCRAASMNIPDPLSPLLPIIYRFWQVFRATSHILI